MRIGFVWQGISDPKVLAGWRDGLWQAVEILKTRHDVTYLEPWDDLSGYDVILYWEAPLTIQGANAAHYRNVCQAPCKKVLLFAGGPLRADWVAAFDLVVVESEINAQECRDQGIPFAKAFGVNCDVWVPRETEKKFLAAHHGACAGWKRQHLGAEALGERFLVVGPRQECDPYTFDRSKELGATVIEGKLPPEECAALVSTAKVLLQTSDYWGGGQRATLEGMAMGLAPVCMEDSPKNREFLEGSGLGRIVRPEPSAIREACEALAASWGPTEASAARAYVVENWSGQKYGADLLEIVDKL